MEKSFLFCSKAIHHPQAKKLLQKKFFADIDEFV